MKDIKLLSKNKYLKVPLLYSGTGGFDKYWKPVSYISNDNLTYANVSLNVGEYIECDVSGIENIANNGELFGEYAYASAFYGDVRITENGEFALHSNSNGSLIFTTPKENISIIKYLRSDSKHVRVVVNDSESKTVDTGYYQGNDKTIGIFHSNHLGNVSNFNIFKILYYRNEVVREYLPAICIKSYETIAIDTVAFVDFANKEIIKAVSGNFVANE